MKNEFRPCSIAGCDGNANPYKKGARGWCGRHYRLWRLYGDPLIAVTPRWEATKWLLDTALNYTGDDCLIWPFRRNHEGRGVIGSLGKTRLAHRLVCEKAHGEPPTQSHHAAHSCGNGHEACVNPHHLRWATAKENFQDRVVHGTNICGEKHGMSKLTEEQVLEIRRRCNDKEPHPALAKEFGVVPSAIWNIANRKRWFHLEPEIKDATHAE